METNEKRVLVTGGGSGIGRDMCHLFAQRGARVCAVDISLAEVTETARTAPCAWGGSCAALPCDVTKAQQVEAPSPPTE